MYLAKRRSSENDDSLKRPTKILVELSQRSTMDKNIYLSKSREKHSLICLKRVCAIQQGMVLRSWVLTGIQHHYHYLAC